MKTIDLAWMAGFVDGEGSIMLVKRRMRHLTKTWTCRVSVTNTNRNILTVFQKAFGGYITLGKENRERHKDCWTWKVESKMAREFLRAIRPYLRLKTRQADILFRYEKTLSTRIGRRGHRAKTERRRNQLHERIVGLNRRGRPSACL